MSESRIIYVISALYSYYCALLTAGILYLFMTDSADSEEQASPSQPPHLSPLPPAGCPGPAWLARLLFGMYDFLHYYPILNTGTPYTGREGTMERSDCSNHVIVLTQERERMLTMNCIAVGRLPPA